jgi:hypothetical protein
MSSHASASAGIWFRAWFGVCTRARLTVVRHCSVVATGYRASSRSTLRNSLTRALSPNHW